MPWTTTDIDVGARLVTVLAAHAAATDGAPLTVPALLTLARQAHPRDALLARAVPVGIQPKLDVVAAFCQQGGYPDLAGLVGAPGPVAGDWQHIDTTAALAAFVATARAAVPARFKPRAERPADVAWYAYFRSHRDDCKDLSPEGKQEIINLIMAGMDPPSALARVLAAQARLTG